MVQRLFIHSLLFVCVCLVCLIVSHCGGHSFKHLVNNDGHAVEVGEKQHPHKKGERDEVISTNMLMSCKQCHKQYSDTVLFLFLW